MKIRIRQKSPGPTESPTLVYRHMQSDALVRNLPTEGSYTGIRAATNTNYHPTNGDVSFVSASHGDRLGQVGKLRLSSSLILENATIYIPKLEIQT